MSKNLKNHTIYSVNLYLYILYIDLFYDKRRVLQKGGYIMKTFFFTCRDGNEGSIESEGICTALNILIAQFGEDVIKIEEMKNL